jgi:hypothetical protein
MGKTFSGIDEALRAFLEGQKLFFVATAPGNGDGHLNLSPKGLESFFVRGPRTVGYIDFNGSGVETIAHLRADGRIVFLFCAFTGSPRIVRLHGRGRAIEPGDAEFAAFRDRIPPDDAVRAVIVADLDRISDSCGYGVPRYDFVGERDQLQKWAARKGADGLREYRRRNNSKSIDGLPGLRRPDE